MTKIAAATRWLGAALTAVAFLIAIPMLLLAAPSPIDPERGIASIVDAIANDGQIFDEATISVLVALAWIAWAYLLLAALAEFVVAIRGGVASIRGLRFGQSIARPVVAALMWSSTATGMAASTFGVGAVALATAPPATAEPAPDHVSSADAAGLGSITADEVVDLGDGMLLVRGTEVRPHIVEVDDTLWDLAETHLGDPFRWREIANLNDDLADPDLIVAGSLIYLPAEAINVNSPAAPSAEEPVVVTVVEGDTLWDLADDQIRTANGTIPEPAAVATVVASVDRSELISGDPDLIYPGESIALRSAPEIVVWTPGSEAPDTGAETDEAPEELIDLTAAIAEAEIDVWRAEPGIDMPTEPAVGEELAVPPSGHYLDELASGEEPPQPVADAAIDLAERPPIPEVEREDGATPDESNGWDPPAQVPASAQVPQVAATPSIPVPGGAPVQPDSNSTYTADQLADPAGPRTVRSLNWNLILTAVPLLAGGMWLALRRRRRLRTTQRPSRYAPTELSAAEEEVTEALAGSPTIERAVRVEAFSKQITSWVPMNAPPLIAVTIDETALVALWDAPTAPLPVGEPPHVVQRDATWRIAVDDLVTAGGKSTTHGLPGMIHVGTLESGRDLFLNLEETRRLSLTGDPDAIQRFCGRLAMELALSPMFELGTLALVGFGRQLGSLDNVEYYDTADEALAGITARVEPVHRALADESVLQRRAAGPTETDLSPVVVIDLSDESAGEDLAALADEFNGGLCLIHRGEAGEWPIAVNTENVHVGGPLDVDVVSKEPSDEAISQIAAMVAADVDYEPADTIEGVVSDAIPDPLEEVEDPIPLDPGSDDGEMREPWNGGADEADAKANEMCWSEPDPLPAETGVRLRMLGAIAIEGAEFSKKAARYVELIALTLALGGRITVHEISTYMYGGEANTQTIHQLLTRTRKALGDAADGRPRLSFETPTKQYELHDVTSDYQQLVDVCDRIKADADLTREQACQLMDSAVQLIEGPPYAAAGESYDWIYTTGRATQAVIAADSLCRELGEVYLKLGNYPRARWSIRRGLKACPGCEELYEALIRVTAEDGTRADLKALWTEIQAAYDALEMEVPQSLATAYGVAVAA